MDFFYGKKILFLCIFCLFAVVYGYVSRDLPCPPTLLLKVTYENDVIVNEGCELTLEETKNQPRVEYFYANSTALYTLLMRDPDAPTPQNPTLAEVLHWLVVNIPGTRVDLGEVVSNYRSPAPPSGSDPHRYILEVYEQPRRISVEKPKQVQHFNSTLFTETYDLGCPVYSNFFLAQRKN